MARRPTPRLPLDPAAVRRVLAIRLRRFGDTVLMGPALAALKAWAPAAHLAVVVQPGYTAFLELLPAVDEIIVADRGMVGMTRALSRVRAFAPDLTVDFHGGSRAALLTAASGAPVTVGEARFHWPAYTVRIPRTEYLFGLARRSHTVENHLAPLAALGIPTPPVRMTLPVASAARKALAARLERAGVPEGPRAVLFPTSTLRGKQWPLDRWLALARALAAAWDGVVLLQFAPAEDALAARAVDAGSPLVHVLPGLPLAELNAMVASAACVVAHDSLGIHLAAAHGVPTVVLFGATDPARYHPWQVEHVVLRAEGLCCSPCGGRPCRSPYYPWACIDGLDDRVVFETTLAWLRGERPGAREPGGAHAAVAP